MDGKKYENGSVGYAKQVTGSTEDQNVPKEPSQGSTEVQGKTDIGVSGEVNMESAITADDVMRAGGFGARDDLSSLLPGAVDSTDFEESLLGAQDYEEPQGEKSRPGLGWTETKIA